MNAHACRRPIAMALKTNPARQGAGKPAQGRPKPSAILLPMRVWDGATRLCSWGMVLLIGVSFASIKLAGGDNTMLWMRVHTTSGFAVMALLLFRLAWGFVGSDTARFSHFLRSPMAVLRYLEHFSRREPDRVPDRVPDREIGHNPVIGWTVTVMLGLLAAHVTAGLFANDGGNTQGPLAHFVTKDISDQMSRLHAGLFKVLMAAVVVHIVAIAVFFVLKGQNLLRPMITGKKRLPAATPAPRMVPPVFAAITFAAAAGVVMAVSLL